MTLQEILANNDPEKLKKLLGLAQSLPNGNSVSDMAPTVEPIDPPTPVSHIPLSPEMLGLSMPPNSSTNLLPVSTKPSAISSEIPLAKTDSVKAPASVAESEEESDPAAVSNLFSKKSPVVDQSPLPVGFTENTVEGLRKAQEDANQQQRMGILRKSANSIASGLIAQGSHSQSGGEEEANKIQDELTSMGHNKVKQFQDRGEKEKDDPNSSASVNMREFARPMMQKLGIKMPENMSYSQMEKVSPMIIKMYEGQEARQARSDDLKFKYAQLAAEKAAKNSSALTDGQKAVDKDFAKHYNEWQATGKPTFQKNLKRLEDAKKSLEKASFGTSGRVVGALPNMVRSEESKRIQQDVQAAAQASLKATLGSQFTEQEGVRIMNMAYDPTLSPKENIRKIDMAIDEIKAAAQSNDDRSKVFESKGTLAGYSGSRDKASEKPSKIKVSNGSQTYQIDPSDLADAEKDGFKQVE